MATVVLQYAGAALGTLIGGPVGGIIGRAAGAIAGNIIDQKLFGPGTRRTEGPRLADLRVMTSEEGAPVPRLWGRMRISGQVIWATNFEELATTDTQSASGKGGGGKSKTTTYSYFANFAVGLCEGPVMRIGRVWADGKLIDLSAYTTRFYAGSETQSPDSLITAKQGEGNAPAYRGLAYIVFERMPLEVFGNRIPQLSFEVIGGSAGVGRHVKAVNIIPGSTEFGYDTEIVTREEGQGVTVSENAHASAERSDWTQSIDALNDECANLQAASLVVSWFGNDLRCGNCTIRPGVEQAAKQTEPYDWSVAGTARGAAHIVSTVDGKPAFGGTPSDASVVRAIVDLKTRGLKPVFYPFILMDVPAGNTLPDPYGGVAQAVYPWRGRISCHPGPGRPGTPDKTAAVNSQLASFIGTAMPSHFSVSGTSVAYSGPAEWSYRRMVLHYAYVCAAAGGVEAFVIGSELRGLTTLRSAASTYPFVSALVTLAAEVKAILPDAKVTYAADWSEYFGHQPADGSNDVHFHLDPLWASSAIDVIGIDNYMPLTDWRNGTSHADAANGVASIHDVNYLTSGIAGGEGFDWYYASAADRDAQLRTPITDGAFGKPWVFRPKDLISWWSNLHYDRPGGIEQATPTAFVPQSKPIWFTEAGCPAIDKGTNQPNVFVDAKSSESAVPYYSSGQRDDLMQASYVAALDNYWSATGSHNPVSSVYGAPMVNASRIFLWCWDARPYPAFPALADVWSDGANHARGHWLNGRLSSVRLDDLIREVCGSYGLPDVAAVGVNEQIEGFVIDRPMSARDALEGLFAAFALDAVESGGMLRIINRQAPVAAVIETGERVEVDSQQPLQVLTRTQEVDLPQELRLLFADAETDYRSAIASALRGTGLANRESVVSLPCATTFAAASRRAAIMLQELWLVREQLNVTLPASCLALEPGDVFTLEGRRWRIGSIQDGKERSITAQLYEPAIYEPVPAPDRLATAAAAAVYGKPAALLLDLAVTVTASPAAPWVAASATPWPGALALLRQTGSTAFIFDRLVEAQATMGRALTPLSQGRRHLFDLSGTIDVELAFGALASASELEVLNGANIAAIGTMQTGFEVLQFCNAQLIGPKTWRLSKLLRAQGGSSPEMLAIRPAGADFVLLNGAVSQASLAAIDALKPASWRIGPAQLDHGHKAYRSMTTAAGGRGLRPLSPARLRMQKQGNDFLFNWIRRTRMDGDSWELAEVPLGEQAEAYRVGIYDGATLKRTTDTSAPAFLYTAAQLAADFAVPPSVITISVAQLSAIAGEGAQTWETFNV
jgi:hypothetical protein